ncbi:tetratricopeptide repeat protein [Flavobacterium amniphilum]|uniref:tetratricopeptide repeat protein n=1 Tax=Flavobacterium amniphilum TaxID=1834035 RepID=UPI002029E293|nr:tetratricopeptide repeat protein [Flavobacterium amniphilum]
MKKLSDEACKCIDSVDVDNVIKDSISSGINRCIDKQVMAYQLLTQLINTNALGTKDEKKDVNIVINTNPDSDDYKKHYYEMESYLMENCEAIKRKIATNDVYREKSVSNDPEALKYYNLALKEDKNGNLQKAVEYYKKAIVFDPEFVFAYDNLGITYRKLKEYDKAIDAYEKSLKIDPNGLTPLQNIAIVYQHKKEYKKAIKAYERLAKLDAKNPEVFYGIGQVYAIISDFEKSLDNLCQAYNIYIDQNSPYRSDAEKLIQIVYNEMKKEGKEKAFKQILEKHKIRME